MSATIRYGMNAIIGIIGVLAVGWWFLDNWAEVNLDRLLEGDGQGQGGMIVGREAAFSEAPRSLKLGQLLHNPDVLDDRRRVLLEVDIPFTRLLAPNEAMPPAHLQQLYAEARLPALLKDRCADWQVQIAARCMMTMATVTEFHPASQRGKTTQEARVTAQAVYAVIPRELDPHPGSDETFGVSNAEIRFQLPTTPITEAERASVHETGYAAYRRACEEIRADHGNCGFFWMSFKETWTPDGQIHMSGGANLGFVRAPKGS